MMAHSEQPRVACLGAGAWGRNIVRNLSDLGALASICEPEPATADQMSTMYPDVPILSSHEDVFSDETLDAVAIATPAATHGELVRKALEAGLDVFVEKPLCLSVEEGEALVALAEREERVLMVGHLLWYHPAILKLKELVDEGELGRLQYVYSNRLNLGRIRREENILWSFAPHDVSVIIGLLGEEPNEVEARGGAYVSDDVADVTVSVLSFASGVKAHIFVSWLHPFKEQKLVVVGDQKMAVFDDTDPDHKLRLYPYTIEWRQRFPTPRREEAEPIAIGDSEPLRAELAHFLECVRERTTPRTDGREALRVLSVLAACQRHLEAAAPGGESTVPSVEPTTEPPFFAHETAVIDEGTEIGDDTKIWHFSHVLGNTRIGRGCSLGQNVMVGPNVVIGDDVKIQNNVSVYDGVTLEDHVFVGPSAVFTNVYNPRSEVRRMDELRRTLVRQGASLGANSTVVCGVTIGRYAFVGAGAVVLSDVPDHGLVVGNPGRLVGWMCVCGERIGFDDEGTAGRCSACDRKFEKTGTAVAELDPVTSSDAGHPGGFTNG